MRHSTVRGQTGPGRGFRACCAPPRPPPKPRPFPALLSLRARRRAPSPSQSSAPVRRLSVDEAVKLAIEQNLGIQIERFNPQIQDLSIAQTRASWAPTLTSATSPTARPTTRPPARFRGRPDEGDRRTVRNHGRRRSSCCRPAANYSVSWDGIPVDVHQLLQQLRSRSSASNLSLNVTQPLLRNFKVDNVRQQLQINQKIREITDVNLRATMTQTTRNVKNAYWDLVVRHQQPDRPAAVARSRAAPARPTTRSASRSAPWRRSTSSRRSPKWRATRRR